MDEKRLKIYRLKEAWKDQPEVLLYQQDHGKDVGTRTNVKFDLDEPASVTIAKLNEKEKKNVDPLLLKVFEEGTRTGHNTMMTKQVLPCLQDEQKPMAIMCFGFFPPSHLLSRDGSRVTHVVLHEFCRLITVVSSNLHWFEVLSGSFDEVLLQSKNK
jgi:hypothetical protein